MIGFTEHPHRRHPATPARYVESGASRLAKRRSGGGGVQAAVQLTLPKGLGVFGRGEFAMMAPVYRCRPSNDEVMAA